MTMVNMRIFKALLLLMIAVTIIEGHPLSTSVLQDDKGPLSLAESPAKKTEEETPDTDSLKTDPLKPDLLKPNLKPDLSLKKQKNVEEPERKEEPKPEPKPETSSEVKPKPEDESKPSSSSSVTEPQAPCSSTTDQDCGSAAKPGNYVDQRHFDYDQRQNGTENYRIQLDGLVVVLAPVEALLLAGGMGSEMMTNATSVFDQLIPKPEEDQSSNLLSKPESEKPSLHKSARPTLYASPKAVDGPVSLKLINLIAPLLGQRRH